MTEMKETATPCRLKPASWVCSEDDGKAARAIQDLEAAGFSFRRAHSPIPSHKIMEALKLKKGRVGWFTLTGGILGFLSGFALAIFCSVQWDLIVSGKPIISLIPFFIVGFEFTILFSVFGNVIGLLVCSRLPDYQGLETLRSALLRRALRGAGRLREPAARAS